MTKTWQKRAKALLTAGILAAAMVVVGGCGTTNGGSNSDKKMDVVATVYPVYDIAKQVGGDKVNLTLLVPPGSEPHDWDPKASDLEKIGKAKVFLYSGAGLEPTDKILTKDVLKEAKPYELSKAVELMKNTAEEEDEDEHNGEEHHHSEYDPHVWLDPTNVIKEVDMTVKAFSEADPANKDYYEKNGKDYKEKLAKLDKDYKAFTDTLSQKELIVSHQAFGYFAKHYGLVQVPIMGVSPDAEPTPDRMAKIVAFSKAHQVKAIFGEELVSPKLAEAIANEIGAKVYVLNPVEGLTEEQTKAGETYLSLMEKNLQTLKEALK